MAKYLMQAVSSGVGGDGTVKRWNTAVLDFAGSGFPGPGTPSHVAVAKRTRDDVLVTAGNGSEPGQVVEWDGTTWVKRRRWISPDIDLTGAVSCKTAIRNILAAARPGACIEIPDGILRVGANGSVLTDDIFTVPPGVTVTFAPRGQNYGHRVFNVDAPNNYGSALKVYDKGKLFTVSRGASVIGATLYYPEQ